MQVCHVPRFNTTTMWTPAFEWYVVRCGSKNACSKRDRTTCSKHANHSKLISQYALGDLYDHLTNTRILILIMNKIFILALEIMRKVIFALV